MRSPIVGRYERVTTQPAKQMSVNSINRVLQLDILPCTASPLPPEPYGLVVLN